MMRNRKIKKRIPWLHIAISLVVFIAGVYVSYRVVTRGSESEPQPTVVNSPVPSTTPTPVPLRMRSTFVPYWANPSSDSDFREYERIIYFGVAVNQNGVRENEPGYLKMESILPALKSHNKEVWITIRMTDTNQNLEILNATDSWSAIAQSVSALVESAGFDGVVLDLEVSALPSDGLRARISDFESALYRELHGKSIPMAVALYGDLFYRKRPFDVKAIEANSDEIMIMAYDFHKAGGEPGPNFPLGGKSRYNYDFPTMIRDYLLFVPPEKLTVVYGMYGYDWIVDEKKRPIKPATSLTLHQVKAKFLDSCEWEHCIVRRDEEASESEVNYIDKAFNFHVVWFEDTVSVEKKMNHMRGQGIDSVSYWAWGYY